MELSGKQAVILAEEYYEDLELWYPYYRLKEAGAQVRVAGIPGAQRYASKHGYPVEPDCTWCHRVDRERTPA